MMTCQSCAEQLLEYVYGLLDSSDPAEAQTLLELRAHLESCSSARLHLNEPKSSRAYLARPVG